MKKSLINPLSYVFIIAIVLAVGVYFLFDNMASWPLFLQGIFRLIIAFAYMWAPGIIALYFAKREKISLPIKRKFNLYYLYAALTPIILTLATIVVSLPFAKFDLLFFDQISSSPNFVFLASWAKWIQVLTVFLVIVLVSLIAGFTINLLFSLGQELMWRGYLWEKVKGLGFWKGSLFIGITSGLWTVPIVLLWQHNYPLYPILGSFWAIAMTTLLTPIMLFLRIKGKSILTPAIFAGVLNAFAYLSISTFPESNILLIGMLGLTGFFVMGVMNVLLYYHLKKSPNTLET